MSEISVIMSTYNRDYFLDRAISNILNQTFSDFEFILINNGSGESTKKICEKYAVADNRIKFVNIEENVGISKARQLGISLAAAPFIAFVDDDDICEKEMLEFLYSLATQNYADISICGCLNDYGDHTEPLYVYDELLVLDKVRGLEEFLKRERFHTAPPTKLFKKSLFKGVTFEKNVKIDDIHFVYKLFAAAERTAAQGKPLYRFVKHKNNITGFIHTNRLNPEILNEYLYMQENRVIYLSEKVPEIADTVRYAQLSYMLSMCDKIRTYGFSDCEKQFEYMVNFIEKNLDFLKSSKLVTPREKDIIKNLFEMGATYEKS